MPRRLRPSAFSKLHDPSLRSELIATRRTHRLVFDHLQSCFVRVSQHEHALLVRLRGSTFTCSQLAAKERTAVRRLHALGLILNENEAFVRHRYGQIDIEINSHCNFRCSFCPVSRAPLPKKLMQPDVFRMVLSRISEHGVRSISLNHYGEPTLHPRLVEYISLARSLGIRILLFTNASALKPSILSQLAQLGGVTILVNLPSADPEEFQRLTRSRQHATVIENVRFAVEAGLPVWLTINTAPKSTRRQQRELQQRLTEMTGAGAWITRMVSRAGTLTNPDYVSVSRHLGRLSGCLNYLQKLSVNVDGEVFLCCNDYAQRNVLGDLRKSSIEAIVTGRRAVQLRRWIFGAADPPDGFICSCCEETRPADGRLFIGPIEDWVDPNSIGARRRTSRRLRRVLASFPHRLDVDARYEPGPVRPRLLIHGARFR
jgi:uncharacterized Fe-S cluster-containing radical SAM superfamily protein